ncbi:hypothetical protein P7K49_009602 [Saguinus oedipus]|uniref:Uncharacterized protein n=1 Tax=Saguinus oedipus TaxID=9490 RepID=A0ABQ9VKE9_SAGOE|nr:hypothetical protein P7K49_009602 [Saguinus oedipus]
MQEPGAVVGERCRRNLGLTRLTSRPSRAYSSRSHVWGRGEGLSPALGLRTEAGSRTRSSVGDRDCGLAAGRRHVGQPGLDGPELQSWRGLRSRRLGRSPLSSGRWRRGGPPAVVGVSGMESTR